MTALFAAIGCRQDVDPQTAYQRIHRELDRAELLEAQDEAHQASLRWEGRDPEWAWKFRLLEAEATIARGLNHEVLSALSRDLPPQLANTDLAAKKLSLEALALANMGHFSDAEEKIAAAQKLCRPLTCEIAGEIIRTAGQIELREDHSDEAEEYFHSSLQIAQQRRNAVLEASDQMNIGLVVMGKEHYDESADWFGQALHSSQAIGSTLGEVKALGNIGWDYYKMGDFERARENFAAAAERSHNSGFVKDETIWLNNLGLVYFESGDYAQAREDYKHSLELARGTQTVDLVLASLNALAFVAIRTNQFDEARNYSRQALDLARNLGHKSDELYALLAKAQIAVGSSDHRQAEQLFADIAHNPSSDTSLRWEAQNSLAKLLESEGRTTAAEVQYRQALATVEHARAAIQHEDFRLPFLSNAAHLYDDYINFLIEQGKIAEALQQADYSRAQTLAEGLRVKEKETFVAPSSPRAQQLARRSKSTILFYWLGPEHAYLWAITPAQIRLFPLPPTSEIEAKVERYNQALIRPRDPLDTGNPDGADLYRALVEPAQSLIRPGTRVIILPDGRLNTLNFETLLVTEPKPHYWIEDVTVETAPALRLLEASHSRGKGSEKLLLIGDPITADKSFGVLPNASVEVADIEKHFSPANREVYVRDQATPEAYLSSHPERFGFIHFVAHGTASRLTPLESGVVLTKAPNQDASKLYARDIVAHPLHAELVTVSTCYGAGTRYYTGEGLVGLSWAFLRAGAHHVIGALWEVNDASTPAFMDQLYADLEKGRSPEDSLHTAKLRMLHSQDVVRKPYYWASFQLYMGP
jgi:CHAT domain-containing protein